MKKGYKGEPGLLETLLQKNLKNFREYNAKLFDVGNFLTVPENLKKRNYFTHL